MKALGLVVLALLLLPASSWAEGRARISFERNCRPKIKDDRAIMAILSAFELQDTGTCQYLSTDDPTPRYDFPFIFPARLKGDQGGFRFLVVIDYQEAISGTHNRIIAGRGSGLASYHQLGVAIWPLAS